jgi:hypothetical protein
MDHSKRLCGLSLFGVATFAAMALLSIGCATTMETGYQPRALNDNSTARRGYYASSFTPAAEAAAKDRNADQRESRPTFGGGY